MRDDDVVPTVEVPRRCTSARTPIGAINIVGTPSAGSTATIPVRYNQGVYQVTDTFTWSRGRHLFKTGFDWQHYQFDGYSYSRWAASSGSATSASS